MLDTSQAKDRIVAVALASALAVLLGAGAVAHADDAGKASGTPGWALYEPSQIDWQPAPASLQPGAKVAVLDGDPAKEGFFTMRLLLPDGYKVQPHWHPNPERVTIVSGTLHLGHGDRFDPAQAKALPAGTYSSMQPKMTHFAWAEGETVLQLSTMGPWQIVYVNPADDPRQKAK